MQENPAKWNPNLWETTRETCELKGYSAKLNSYACGVLGVIGNLTGASLMIASLFMDD